MVRLVEIENVEKNQKIVLADTKADCLICCLEGKINNEESGTIFHEDFITTKDRIVSNRLKMTEGGVIGRLSFKDLEMFFETKVEKIHTVKFEKYATTDKYLKLSKY